MALLRTITGPSEHGISSLRLHPTNESLLAATSLDNYAALYDVRVDGPPALIMKGHTDSVNNCLFLDGGNYLATASDDRTVRVFDMRRPDAAALVVRGYKDAINTLASDPLNPSNLVAGADDGCVYVHTYEAPTVEGAEGAWRKTDHFMVSSGTVNDVVVLPGERGLFVSASEEGTIRVWNRNNAGHAANGAADLSQMEDRIVQSYDEFDSAVNHLHLTRRVPIPPPSAAGASGADANNRSWLFAASSEFVFGTTIDNTTGELGEENLAFGCHTDYVRGVEAVTESVLLTVADDCTAIMWDIPTCRPVVRATLHQQMIMAMAVGYGGAAGSSTPSVLFTGCEDGSICMWALPLEGEAPAYDPSAAPQHFPRGGGDEWAVGDDEEGASEGEDETEA